PQRLAGGSGGRSARPHGTTASRSALRGYGTRRPRRQDRARGRQPGDRRTRLALPGREGRGRGKDRAHGEDARGSGSEDREPSLPQDDGPAAGEEYAGDDGHRLHPQVAGATPRRARAGGKEQPPAP